MTSTRDFARRLRQQPTKAEEILWRALRGRRFESAKFRRQVPFGRYVADFYCHAAKLIVELDGAQHEWFINYDAAREADIEAFAHVRMIRFRNEEVLGDLDAVLARIKSELKLAGGALPSPSGRGAGGEGSAPRLKTPHPCPSPEGRGVPRALPPSPFGRGVGGEGSAPRLKAPHPCPSPEGRGVPTIKDR